MRINEGELGIGLTSRCNVTTADRYQCVLSVLNCDVLHCMEGAGLEGKTGKVMKLRRDIHRPKQASTAWNEWMEGELAKRGLVCLDADSALWIMHGKNGKFSVSS